MSKNRIECISDSSDEEIREYLEEELGMACDDDDETVAKTIEKIREVDDEIGINLPKMMKSFKKYKDKGGIMNHLKNKYTGGNKQRVRKIEVDPNTQSFILFTQTEDCVEVEAAVGQHNILYLIKALKKVQRDLKKRFEEELDDD